MVNYLIKPKGTRLWKLRYRLDSKEGRIKEKSLGTTDKQIARKRADEFLRDLELEREGLIPPKRLREAAKAPLLIHMENFTRDLRRQGQSTKYVDNVEYRIKDLCQTCGWLCAKDVTASDFLSWRNNQSWKPKTLNDYLDSIRGFFKWMVKFELVSVNPLSEIEKIKRSGIKSRDRRALTQEEIQRLLAIESPYRLVYLTAVYTGLRRGELESLEWGDVILEAEKPYLLVRASTTKNGLQANIRLHPDLFIALKNEHQLGKDPSSVVFKSIPRVDRFKKDL